MAEKESKNTNIRNINILVKDEEELYNSLSPDNEFNMNLKLYLRSKCTNMKLSDSISLTVLHSDPIDEGRFREAVTHWIEEEKAVFKQESSISNHLLVGMLVIASVFIILSLSLQKRFDVLSYTIIPVLGSVALGRAAGIFIVDMPINNAKKQLLSKLEQKNIIVFKQIEE